MTKATLRLFAFVLISVVTLPLLATSAAAVDSSYSVEKGYFRYVSDPHWTINNGAPANQRCGSKALVLLAYREADQWYSRHPNNPLQFWDMNAPGHATHKNGIDFDVSSTNKTVGDIGKDTQGSIELAKMFVDSGIVDWMLFNDKTVQNAVNSYAGHEVMRSESGHNNHMHIHINERFSQVTQTTCGASAVDLSPSVAQGNDSTGNSIFREVTSELKKWIENSKSS